MVETDDDKPEHMTNDRSELVSRIDELERLLSRKKAESVQPESPRMKFGTDGIPVLVDIVDPENMTDERQVDHMAKLLKQDQMIEDIIDKVDQEISQDLDELIGLLKDSIIDEVKTRLLREFANDKKDIGQHD